MNGTDVKNGNYGDDVIRQIKAADDEHDIAEIMWTARHKKFG